MKKIIFALFTFIIFSFLIPGQSHGQNTGNPDDNPCFSLHNNGSCVCFPNGKLKVWLASVVIIEAKSTLDQEGCNSLMHYLDCYYRTDNVKIVYLGGDWENGQVFQVSSTGGGVIITTIDGF